MQNAETYFDEILVGLSTAEEARLLQNEVDALISSLYKTEPSAFENTLDAMVRAKSASAIKKALAGGVDKGKFLAELRNKLSLLKSLKITLAYQPSQEVIQEIHAWIARNIGPKVLLEPEVDKGILGGAIISYQGKYIDNSLMSQLEDYFQK